MFRPLIISALLFLTRTPPAWTSPSWDATLSQDKIQADQTTELRIEASWPKREGQYSFGFPQIPLQNLILSNQAQSQETFIKKGEEWTHKVFTLEFTPENPGEGTLGDFQVTYANSESMEASGKFSIPSFKIQIVKPSFRPLSKTAGLVGGSLAFAILLGGGVYFFRRRRPVIAASEEKIITPTDKALEHLQKARGSVTDISKVFREFLGGYYSGLSPKYSESEMVEALQKLNLSTDELKSLQRILDKLGEAKFTGPSQGPDLTQIQKEITEYIESKRIVGSVSAP